MFIIRGMELQMIAGTCAQVLGCLHAGTYVKLVNRQRLQCIVSRSASASELTGPPKL